MSNLNTEAYLRAKGIIDNDPIDDDRYCQSCGYNLRGLKYGHKCPECGKVIERRSRGYEHFMDAPVGFMKRIRTGLGLITAGYWLFTGTIMVVIIAQPRNLGLLFIIFLSGCCLTTGGLWIVTRIRPDAPVRQPHRISVRRVIRILSIASSLLLIMVWIMMMQWLIPSAAVWWFLNFVSDTAVFTMAALAAWLFADYARWVHDDELSGKFDIVIGLFILLWIIDMMLSLFGASIPVLFDIMILVSLGTYAWCFINIVRLFDLINRAVRDKRGYDANILRDPEKILR